MLRYIIKFTKRKNQSELHCNSLYCISKTLRLSWSLAELKWQVDKKDFQFLESLDIIGWTG